MALNRLPSVVLLAMVLLPVPQAARQPVPAQQPAPAPKPAPEFTDLAALLASLPDPKVAPLDDTMALTFTALPLTCVDDLQPPPSVARAPYFWQPTYRTVEAFDRTRAFYGCGDWPTAVSATWTMVALLRAYPDLGSGPLIREKLTAHLGRGNLEGERAYFEGAGNAQRPYGYAWFLRLYGDLATWPDADAARYAENAAPLARAFADGIVGYLVGLERPNRGASQSNSALALGLLLDYADTTRDTTVRRAVSETARRFYAGDTDCETGREAAAPEAVSPCLEEAALMSRVLEQAEFTSWLDRSLPSAESDAFRPLRSIDFDLTEGRGGGRGRGRAAGAAEPEGRGRAEGAAEPQGRGRGRGRTNPRASWIGLAFTRAAAYARLADALPAGDARVPVFRRLGAMHAAMGQRELLTSAAFDAPWVGAFAVSYLVTHAGTGGRP